MVNREYETFSMEMIRLNVYMMIREEACLFYGFATVLLEFIHDLRKH